MFKKDSALILVVDDDDFTRMHLCHLIKQAGYQFAQASNGLEALATYTKLHPDIVLVDAVMPVMDGFTCCAQLQTLPEAENTFVLIMTALNDQASVEQAFAVGATDFVTKPIQWTVLSHRLRRLLEGNYAIQELRRQTQSAQLREQHIAMALDAAHMGIWNWNLLTNQLSWSDSLQVLYGWEKSTFDGTYEAFINCIHPQDQDLVRYADQRAIREGIEYSLEFRVVLSDGNIRWLASKGAAFHDASGVPVWMCGLDIDITKSKEAESALETRANQQAVVAELSQQALARTDLTTLMNSCVTLVAQHLKVEYCKILELLPDGDALLLRAGVGWLSGLVGQARVSSEINSQAGYTLLSQSPVIVTNLQQETRFNAPALLHEHQVVGGISVVIHGQESPFGVLGAHTTRERTFTKDDVYFIQAVANILATAIERQRFEDALKKSEERWQLAVRSTNDGIWDWNLKTNEMFFSRRWKEMLGYEDEEISSDVHEWCSRIHPEDFEAVQQAIADHNAKKTPFLIIEHQVQCQDGSYKWILARGQAVWDDDGYAVRMIGGIMDISDRRAALDELQQVQAQLQRQNLQSLAAASAAQLFADITLKIRQSLEIDQILQTSVTEVQKLLHADRVLILQISNNSYKVRKEAVVPGLPVILGEHITDLCLGEDYSEKYRQGGISAIADIEQVELEPSYLKWLQKFGVKANLIVPVFCENQLWGLLIAHQCDSASADLSVRPREWIQWEIELLRQLADQIGIALDQSLILDKETRQRHELARSNQELQEFAFIASHDLQEPLRKIISFGDRLTTTSENDLSPQGRDYLERMQNAALRMQTLIKDLLTLSRVTTRAQPFVAVNLTQIAQEVLSDLEVTIQHTNGRVEVGDLPTIKADPLQMRQLLQNLIGNALKFHHPQTPPVVKVYSQILPSQFDQIAVVSEICQITVEDNGIGLEQKYVDRIFNIFQRLHSRQEYQGTGMGLAICRKIAQRHQGVITVESQPGQGAKFMVKLPMNGNF
ncbi:PAS domain-containing protein [Nodularia sphaerocarpa]|uniref:PAS domain-containing protein n=1 Tax=Nodularia sphaerocarpa TaxID=137816 RepID=UPI001EFB4AA6|nr:PAS domain-containing protein [Nodularia sphaerocarpa]MDB9373515.1 PAS domain-containing protein [Nodularia sphaerocarpa CS-585]MDB9380307.1 PAS domain-containing protein [Nodularia sphaerocarpa CS-585A2]ULP71342.1 Phytochrome-like protein cph1 [Nodularia sphaerocarpa UHCC 0038]